MLKILDIKHILDYSWVTLILPESLEVNYFEHDEFISFKKLFSCDVVG